MNFLIDEELPDYDKLTVKPTGTFKAVGMGVMRGFTEIEAAGTRGLSLLQEPLNPRGAEKTRKFYEEYVKPAREFWTPEPGSVSGAGEMFGGIAGLVPSLLFGPYAGPLLVGQAGINTAFDLHDEGVDLSTSIKAGALDAATMAALVKIPAFGKTIKQSLGLAAVNPLAGMASRKGMNELLSHYGYDDQAARYDPFDPTALSIDVVLGGFFGMYGHAMQARSRRAGKKIFETEKERAIASLDTLIESPSYHESLKGLPIEVEDALGVIRQHQKIIKDTPFDYENPRAVSKHIDALNKALDDLRQDKPVDVAEKVAEVQRVRDYPSIKWDEQAEFFREAGLSEDAIKESEIFFRANAKARGEDFDNYVSKYFAGGVVHKKGEVLEVGKALSEELLYQDMKPQKGAGDISTSKTPVPEGGKEIGNWSWTSDGKYRVDRMPTENRGAFQLGWAVFDKKGNLIEHGSAYGTVPTKEALSLSAGYAKHLAFLHANKTPKLNKKIFFRFGDIPDSGKSINAITGKAEDGISAYQALTNVHNEILWDQNNGFPQNIIGLWHRPAYEISGNLLKKTGADGEVLLRNAKIVRRLSKDELGKLLFGEEYRSEELLYQDMKPQKGAGDISTSKTPVPEGGWTIEEWRRAKDALGKRQDKERKDFEKNFARDNNSTEEDLIKDYGKHGGIYEKYDREYTALSNKHLAEISKLNEQVPPESNKPEIEPEYLTDASKEPEELKLYHNTLDDFTEFDSSKLGKNFSSSQNRGNDLGFFFTTNPEFADMYGSKQIEITINTSKFYRYDVETSIKDWIVESYDDPQHALAALNLPTTDPKSLDAWDVFSEEHTAKEIDKALKDGKDGIIFDFGDLNWGRYGKVVVIFNPNKYLLKNDHTRPAGDAGQALSEEPLTQSYKKYGNTVTKGAVSFLEDGRAVIHAFEAFDFTTLIHETGHIFRRNLPDAELNILKSEYKITGDAWERHHEELFAKQFERYVTEGDAPTPELKGVFEKFKKWMTEIYRNLIGEDVWNVKMTPKVREVMDRLFIESEIPLKKAETPETVAVRKTVADEIKALDEDIMMHAEDSHIPGENIADIGKIGGSIVKSLYQGLFDALTQGKNKFSGVKDPVLKRAKPYYEAGLIKTPADLQKFENNGYPNLEDSHIPVETTTVESWGTGETIMPGDAAKEKKIEAARVKYESRKAYDAEHLEYIKDRIGQGEAGGRNLIERENATGRDVVGYGSSFPEWFKNKGYTKKAAMKALDRAVKGEKLGAAQLRMIDDLIESSMGEYKPSEMSNDPVARYVEKMIAERGDIPTFEGTDAKGEAIEGGMKKYIDDAKNDLNKTSKLEDMYHEISKCIR